MSMAETQWADLTTSAGQDATPLNHALISLVARETDRKALLLHGQIKAGSFTKIPCRIRDLKHTRTRNLVKHRFRNRLKVAGNSANMRILQEE